MSKLWKLRSVVLATISRIQGRGLLENPSGQQYSLVDLLGLSARSTNFGRTGTAFLCSMPVATRRQRSVAGLPLTGSSGDVEKTVNSGSIPIVTPVKLRSKRSKNDSPESTVSCGVMPVVSPEKPRPRKLAIPDDSISEPKSKRVKKEKSTSPKPTPPRSEPPQNWEEIYGLVEELRSDRTAPCDTMGCEALATRDAGDLPGFRFQALVALLLSSQTKDAIVAEAVLFMKKDGILSVEAIRQPNITEDLLSSKYLAKVGFRNNKAKFLKQVVDILHENYGGDIPPTASEMIDQLPGIGPKMAYICESVAWDPPVPSGIGVDTHMHRLFNQLEWVKAKTPEQTRVQLESWLPTEKWKTVNLLWVGFGQEVQQEKAKILRKALDSAEPAKSLDLLKSCGMDLNKEGKKLGLQDAIQKALAK